jgi:hypothetical protein
MDKKTAMQEREPDHSAPEGAVCAEHHGRPAAFTCPRCGNYACIFCWHALSSRCDACLKRDPAAAAPPLAWEGSTGNGIGRYFGTLGSAFRPVRSAPAFARPQVRPALRFFLLSALPMAALAGVIPYTKTLMFGSSLAVTVQGHPTSAEIATDVARAMLIQLGLFGLDFAALALPFTSLVRAYADETKRPAALRALLYRSWLLPAATLLFFLAVWLLPPGPTPEAASPFLPYVFTIQLTFNALLLLSMRATARFACGITPLLSYTVTAVPLVIWMIVQWFVQLAAPGAL